MSKFNKIYKSINREWFKWHLAACSAFLFLAIFFLFTFLSSSPTEDKKEMFRSRDEVILTGEYKGYACGDFTPQITPVKGVPLSISEERFGLGFVFYVPPNVVAPDQIDNLRVPGNLFELKGYFYYTVDEAKYLHYRFDLIAWHPIVPFKRWTDNGEIEIIHETNIYEIYRKTIIGQAMTFKPSGKYVISCD